MNKLKVELLSYTPVTTLLKALSMPYKKETSDLTLAQKVINVLKHESVSEHISMSFLIDGISRAELQEHMRHRIASTTCESTRYTLQKLVEDLNNPEDEKMDTFINRYFVIPEYIEEHWNHQTDYFKFIQELRDCYELFVAHLDNWVDHGVKNDYIKYALPEGYRTRFVWTINIRSLKNFLNLRLANNAHFEIRNVAAQILDVLKNTYIYPLVNKEN
jgi:thymidylate synthase (FAD)